MKKTTTFIIFLSLGLTFFSFQSQALTISPAKLVLSADPGQTITTQMRVRNDMDQTLDFYPSFDAYTARGEEPMFYPSNFGLPTWIKIDPPKLTLKAGEKQTVTILISVPKDADPGGHYAAIFWAASPPGQKGEGGVGIVTKVGALVLLEVSGDVIESAELSNFKAPAKFFTHLPISFTFELKNTGTVHLMPEGKVVIQNILGRTSTILEVNPGLYHVLPNTTRAFYVANWEPKGGMPKIEGGGFIPALRKEIAGFALGYYRANLNLEYGNGKEIKTDKASFGFWVLPWRVLILIIFILAAILFLFTKGINKYNKWLIAKATENLRNIEKAKKG